jgi:hypothetical protein
MLVPLTALHSWHSLLLPPNKAKPRKPPTTNNDVDQLLNYFASHPDAILRYHASDMVLKIHSDDGYLNESHARSRARSHFYLGNHDDSPKCPNGAILNPTEILRYIASSATEAKVGAPFVKAKEGEIIRTTLAEMDHPQPATPVTTNNSTANGIMNDTMKHQCSRAIDMQYHWVRDRVTQAFSCFVATGIQKLGRLLYQAFFSCAS